MRILLATLIALAALAETAQAVTITYTRTDFPSGRPPERQMAPRSTDNDTFEEVFSTGNALDVFNRGRGAGERNPSSTTGTDYMSTSGEWAVKAVAYNGTLSDRTICSGPCIVAGIEVTTAMSNNASQLESGGTTVYPIAASRAAGLYPFPGPARFLTDCVWDPGSLSAGAILVWFRPLDADSTWTQ